MIRACSVPTIKKKIIRGEVLVIGMARQGKSHLGNAIAGFPDEELFPTADGCTLCTSEIKSEQLNGLESDCDRRFTFNINYTDTPGFPDSDDDDKTVEIFDSIVDYINNKRPDAIVWLINPGNRNPEDKEMYQRYSLLLKEFSRSGIYCTVLVNNQGSKNKYNTMEKKKQGLIGIRGQIKDYGCSVFTPFDPEISLYEDELADTLLTIFAKATVPKVAVKCDPPMHKMRTFQDMKDMYLNHFNDVKEKTEEFLRSKTCELSAAVNELTWHEKRVDICEKLLSLDWLGKMNLLAGLTMDIAGVSFGLGTGAAEGVNQITKHQLEFLIDESNDKIPHLKEVIVEVENEIANQDPDEMKKHAKQSLEEYVTILKALRQEDDIADVKNKHPTLFDENL